MNEHQAPVRQLRLFAVSSQGPVELEIPPAASSVHELLSGQPVGVYTAFRTFEQNKFLLLDKHLDRIVESMGKLGWDYELDQKSLRVVLHQICTEYKFGDSRIRIDVLADRAPDLGVDSRLFISQDSFKPLDRSIYRQGVVVGTAGGLKRLDPKVKSAEFVEKRRKYLEHRTNIFEVLLIDERGFILEGASSNFFAVRDGVLYTAGQGALEGTARSIVIQAAKAINLSVRFEAPHVDEIGEYSECAISSSSRDIIPVVKVDKVVIGGGRPGAITARLLKEYRSYVKESIRPAVGL